MKKGTASPRDLAIELAPRWRRMGHELAFGVGIATGYATLGRIGYEGRYDRAAIGNVTIRANRLSSAARGGQILIGQRVHAAVEEAVDAEPLGALEIKGITRPVTAFNVRALRD